MAQKYFVHPLAVVEENVEIGEGTRIWHFAHIRKGAKIEEPEYGTSLT